MSDYHVAQSPRDLLPPGDATTISGLEWLERVISGDIAGPPIAGTLGFRLVEVRTGWARFLGTPAFSAVNPMGTTHGGWYGAILDSAMACAVQSGVPAGRGSTTLEYKVNILRPLPAGMEAACIGVANHVGRTTGVATAELRGRENGKLYATASTTCQVFEMVKRGQG